MSETEEPNAVEREFAARTSVAFAASTARLDARRLSKLNEARQLALAELGGQRFRVPGLWLPAGALATVAMLAIAVSLVGRVPPGVEATPVEDVEIMASRDGFDLYAEDPEFYEWASTPEAAGNGPDAGVG
jgi:hypothetical protein